MSKEGKKHDPKVDVAANSQPVEPQANNHGVAGDEPSAEEKKISELTHDLQRLQAEFQNFKRREGEAKAELMNLAKREVLMQLLPLLDNIDRALGHRPEELKGNAWANGVEQVGRQVQESLAKLGVKKIESLGQPFDHNLHEAISMEDGDGDNEVVVEELQPGYTMGDMVIRHAMVRVGRQK